MPSLTKSSGLVAGGEHEILIAVVVHVGEERLRGVVEHAEARALGHVLERRVAASPEEPIGQPRGLGDVEIVEPVAVGIADRHAVMAVRVARQHRVERRHPGVEIGAELAPERVVAAERRLGDLGEDRAAARGSTMRRGRPSTTCHPDASRRQLIPRRPRARRATPFVPAPTMS